MLSHDNITKFLNKNISSISNIAKKNQILYTHKKAEKLEKRLCDFSEIKAHKWLKDVNWDIYLNKAVKSPITIDF